MIGYMHKSGPQVFMARKGDREVIAALLIAMDHSDRYEAVAVTKEKF
jgi:hypothetical protein